jgi:hypothetical protein
LIVLKLCDDLSKLGGNVKIQMNFSAKIFLNFSLEAQLAWLAELRSWTSTQLLLTRINQDYSGQNQLNQYWGPVETVWLWPVSCSSVRADFFAGVSAVSAVSAPFSVARQLLQPTGHICATLFDFCGFWNLLLQLMPCQLASVTFWNTFSETCAVFFQLLLFEESAFYCTDASEI